MACVQRSSGTSLTARKPKLVTRSSLTSIGKARRVHDPGDQLEIIRGDPYLSSAYRAAYDGMLEAETAHLSGAGARIEIGSAGGFLGDVDPAIVATDVRVGPDVDLLATSERLPFRSGSVRTIFAKDCLHHIPDIEALFEETRRVCVPGGGLVCYEPYWSPLARVVYRHLHPEDFDPKVESWAFESNDPLTAANQALPYIVLRRDRERFDSLFPELE
ncbi:MAG: methyltransferase domain-containing protein, partial [Acidimicrobiia bacterium]|nr:methyltransferase domain-containing protein [Acidimicrobiia bacterium]